MTRPKFEIDEKGVRIVGKRGVNQVIKWILRFFVVLSTLQIPDTLNRKSLQSKKDLIFIWFSKCAPLQIEPFSGNLQFFYNNSAEEDQIEKKINKPQYFTSNISNPKFSKAFLIRSTKYHKNSPFSYINSECVNRPWGATFKYISRLINSFIKEVRRPELCPDLYLGDTAKRQEIWRIARNALFFMDSRTLGTCELWPSLDYTF